jgi:hypothetical protein
MIVENANIYLYTGLTASASDSFAAKDALDTAGVQYTHLHYADSSQHEGVFSAISTWFPESDPITDFPFVVYDERHDDWSVHKRCLVGKDTIIGAIEALA